MMKGIILLVFELALGFALRWRDIPYVFNLSRPLVIAHRGSSGDYPEHTIGSHSDAFFSGTDFTEADLQISKDQRLIVQHEPCLKKVTNIEEFPEFQSRKRATWQYDNDQCQDDWFINDFTLEELKRLNNKQRVVTRNQELNYVWNPITLEEFIELVLKLNEKYPRNRKYPVGLYIETKIPEYYESIGINMNQLFLDVLKKYNVSTVKDCTNRLPIIIQSFYNSSLIFFNKTTDLPRIQLLRQNSIIDFDFIQTFAHGVGPQNTFIFKDGIPTDFIKTSHSHDLLVHPWVVRDDDLLVANNAINENLIYMTVGADGIFTEFPHLSYEVFIKH